MSSQFRRYDHLVRLGHSDAREVELGTVYVFPKLDGTNASVWASGGEVHAGSRNRVLSVGQGDNAGFCAWLQSDDPTAETLRRLALELPHLVFYGEWLVPHTLKTYREDAWRRFWVFDVFDRIKDRYLSWEDYSSICHELDLIAPLCSIKNPSEDQLRQQVEVNTYLLRDGAGLGEGVVVKNYAWTNHRGAQPWAKVVRNSFKEKNAQVFGVTKKNGEKQVESDIAEEFCTPHLIGKTHAKVLLDLANKHSVDTASPNWQQTVTEDYRGQLIPQLLGRVFHDLVEEECWAFVKRFKNPTVNFKKLQTHCTLRVKQVCADLF